VPVTNDSALFEQLTLEGAQAGFSWSTVLRKRECYRILFKQFSIGKAGRLTSRDVDAFIRHRGKLESVVSNARFFADIQRTHGSFYSYVLGVVNDLSLDDSVTVLSERLKLFGFSFVGPTIVESFLLAAGFWNGHSGDCFRRSEIEALRPLEKTPEYRGFDIS
jgi:DNA-3-methyladenine glycosylase I